MDSPPPSSDPSPRSPAAIDPVPETPGPPPIPGTEGTFYKLDYSRGSFQEFFWGNPPARYPIIAISALIIKLGRIRTPGSSDHPPVEALKPFEVAAEALPPEIQERFEPLIAELTGLGFWDPVFHSIQDSFHSTRIFRATFRHSDGRAWARIHHRIWDYVRPPRVYLFPQFLSAFSDGTWLLSCAGKRDTLEPPSFRVNRHTGMTATALWESHQKSLALETGRTLLPAETAEAVAVQSEASHAVLRDFHLRRRFFQPMTEAERQTTSRLSTAAAAGDTDSAIHEELDRLIAGKRGWGNAVTILIVSLIAFLVAGAGQDRDWKFLLLLVPILFIHELGHYFAMRGFQYRNLRMFFIPLFGAAVTGQNFNIAGWKKALVYLAGPVPSIVLAVVVGSVGLLVHRPWLTEAAFVTLLINAFNLLPVLPLDGGWVMQVTVFSRHHLLDTTFRILAALALIVLGLKLDTTVLAVLGGLALFALPASYKLARITSDLRRQNLSLPRPDEAGIPRATANVIIQQVKLRFSKGVTNKSLAQHALQVFESLNTRPPGWAASLGLLGLQGGSLLLAVIFGGVLALDKARGGLLGGFGGQAWAPKREVACDSTLTWRGPEFAWGRSNTLLLADFAQRPPAEDAFRSLTNQLPATASLRCFGSTLFVSLPATDPAARDRWFDSLERLTTNVHALTPRANVGVQLAATAPDESTAEAIEHDLSVYFEAPNPATLRPPWLLEGRASETELAAFRKARTSWVRLSNAGENVHTNAALKAVQTRINQAIRRANRAEAGRLDGEYQAERRRLERETIAAFRDTPEQPLDTNLAAAYLRLPENQYTNRNYRDAVLALAPNFGPLLPGADGQPKPAEQAVTLRSGGVVRKGALITVPYADFDTASEGLPALADWLCAHGCRDLKYNLYPPSGEVGDDSEEDNR